MYPEVRRPLDKFIARIEQYESEPMIQNGILFYGDSGFTRWATDYDNNRLDEDIRAKDGSVVAINHGLGGSNTDQLLYWYHRMVRPYKPRVLVFKSFLNDRAAGYSIDEILFLQSRIFGYARTDMPGIKIIVSDCQPTFANKDLKWRLELGNEYNIRLEDYCAKHDDTVMAHSRLIPQLYENCEDIGDYTKVRGDIFIEDGVHFNREGYKYYADFWREQLKDYL